MIHDYHFLTEKQLYRARYYGPTRYICSMYNYNPIISFLPGPLLLRTSFRKDFLSHSLEITSRLKINCNLRIFKSSCYVG
jgi:hypothetical protein